MKFLPLVCVLFALFGTSCDGYIRSFRVVPPVQRVGSSQISTKDPVSTIRKIAFQHGFKEDPPQKQESEVAAFSKPGSQQTTIYILVVREELGNFRVLIVDWPSLRRSAESVLLEEEIRRAL